jgi:hypothetical protein
MTNQATTASISAACQYLRKKLRMVAHFTLRRVLCVAAVGLCFAQDKPATNLVSAELRYQMALVQAQAEVLRLKACSEAGILHSECVVNWQAGTATRAEKK